MIGSLTAAAALLLLVSGAAKIRVPQAAVPTLAAVLRFRGASRGRLIALARALGVAELVVGVVVLATGDRAGAVLLALLYASFAAVSALLIATGRQAPCGCFGARQAPVGAGHLAVTLLCCATGIAAAVAPPGPAGGFLDATALVAVTGLLQVLTLAALAYLTITSLPELAAARRGGAR